MTTPQPITEEDGVHEQWYKQAEDGMSMDKLPEFLRHLTEDYIHDYGTICHALSAGAVATCWAMNRTKQGGITGFQSSFIMWGFIRNWLLDSDGPMRLVRYSHMLFPQHDHDFAQTISADIWKWLQEEAQKKLGEPGGADHVRAHWQSIVDGVVPFGYRVEEER
jgi:hypothetical protein